MANIYYSCIYVTLTVASYSLSFQKKSVTLHEIILLQTAKDITSIIVITVMITAVVVLLSNRQQTVRLYLKQFHFTNVIHMTRGNH